MSPLAKLRVELTNLVYRIQTGKLRGNREVMRACAYLELAQGIVGAELKKELEAAKAKEGGRV